MIDEIEYKGEWQIPGTDTWYNGVLKFSPQERTTLEIFGSFNNGFLDRTAQPILIGRTSEGEVTLVDSQYRSTKHTRATGVTIGEYTPSFVIIGHHFSNEQDVSFRSVSFRLFNLFEWLSVSGTKFNSLNNARGYKMEYSQPAPIKFTYFDNCSGEILFNYSMSLSHVNHHIESEEHSTVKLTYASKRNLRDILMDIYVFSGFITLNTFEQSYATRVTLQDEDYCEDKKPKVISCLYNNPSYNSKYKQRTKGEHLVHYDDIKEKFPELINSWYQKYYEIKPVFSLLLYSFKDKLKFSEDNFMDIVRAIETFHRRTQNNTRFSPEQFELMRTRILEKLDGEDRQLVAEKLNYANEPSLRKRLTDLINGHSNTYLQSKIVDIKSFCNSVVESRNYYTHYDNKSEDNALRGKELFQLTQVLTGLLISCLYRHLGLNNDIIEVGLKRTLNRNHTNAKATHADTQPKLWHPCG